MDEQLLDEHLTQHEEYPNENDYDQNLHGLSGWLAFLGFSLISTFLVTTILNGKNYYSIIPRFSLIPADKQIWIGLEFVMLISMVLYQIALLYFYFNKKKRFILFFKIYLLYFIMFEVIDKFVITPMVGMEVDPVTMVRPVLYAIIWASYIYQSKQVKHTFVFK